MNDIRENGFASFEVNSHKTESDCQLDVEVCPLQSSTSSDDAEFLNTMHSGSVQEWSSPKN